MMRPRAFLAAAALVTGASCTSGAGDEALSLATVSDTAGVEGVERLIDGERALEGAPWSSAAAAFFHGKRAFVTFDLGRVTPIDAVYLQGDNNDRFVLEASDDGVQFRHLWTAPAVDGQGQRRRTGSGLGGRGRFVRLRAVGGDDFVSATEIQLFAARPALWPPWIRPRLERGSSLWAQLSLALFGVLAVLTALVDRCDSKKRTSVSLWGVTGAAAVAAAYSIATAWPPEASLINVSRAVSALVACSVILVLGFRAERARKPVLTGLLVAMAVLSIASFYNFGFPQFYDAAGRKPSYVHTWDMRVYFPVAKYFDELGYDGVYLASLKAYADDVLGGSLDPIRGTQARDLRSYEMTEVSEISSQIHAVKDRFSPERWSELKADMSYFWKTMGKEAYLGSLRDHGANATPAWILIAHAIYGSASASETTFLLGALLDPVLLLLFFAVAWRTFGLRAALVCLVAYGATTIYQFGTNWGGSTLRNDWMVLLGLGVCALHAKRPFVGGSLLGWSAMIRAFPALALAFMAAPVGWRLLSSRRARNAGAEESSARPQVLFFVKAAAGALMMVIVLGAASTHTFGFDQSWGAWSEKIALHATKPNINHLGITALVGYKAENLGSSAREPKGSRGAWAPLTAKTVEERRPIIVLGALLFTALAFFGCRGARLSDAAVIGTMMIPIYFYPANYYLHILFIWPLLHAGWNDSGHDERWALIAASVLACCAIQWFGWLIPGRYGQFLFWSGTLLALIAALLILSAYAHDRRVFAPERVK
jgi:hypothetical protein